MAATIDSVSQEIDILRERIAKAESVRPQLQATLLSLPTVSQTLSSTQNTRVQELLTKQIEHSEAVSYRLIAGITAFKVHDPDPYAVDNGNVLGLRFEVPKSAAFDVPYFVFLVKVDSSEDDEDQSSRLRVHKHTFPAGVDVAAFASRYLPVSRGEDEGRAQDLFAFARELRTEVMAWHKRVEAVEKLRAKVGLPPLSSVQDDEVGSSKRARQATGLTRLISDITSDAQAFVISILLKDSTEIRIRIDRSGSIQNVAVSASPSSDLATRTASLRSAISGGDSRIEGTITRLISILR